MARRKASVSGKSKVSKDLLQIGIWAVVAIIAIVVVVSYFLR